LAVFRLAKLAHQYFGIGSEVLLRPDARIGISDDKRINNESVTRWVWPGWRLLDRSHVAEAKADTAERRGNRITALRVHDNINELGRLGPADAQNQVVSDLDVVLAQQPFQTGLHHVAVAQDVQRVHERIFALEYEAQARTIPAAAAVGEQVFVADEFELLGARIAFRSVDNDDPGAAGKLVFLLEAINIVDVEVRREE